MSCFATVNRLVAQNRKIQESVSCCHCCGAEYCRESLRRSGIISKELHCRGRTPTTANSTAPRRSEPSPTSSRARSWTRRTTRGPREHWRRRASLATRLVGPEASHEGRPQRSSQMGTVGTSLAPANTTADDTGSSHERQQRPDFSTVVLIGRAERRHQHHILDADPVDVRSERRRDRSREDGCAIRRQRDAVQA